MNSIGIMQGRFTPSIGRGIQFFPFENWQNEFNIAAELGLDEIEFIFDYERYKENPLYTQEGLQEIKRVITQTGIKVNSICFDYFMRRPFYKMENDKQQEVKNENDMMLDKLIRAGEAIDAHILEIPVVDDSSIKSSGEEMQLIELVGETARKTNMTINLECDYPPAEFKRLLDTIALPNVKANYDSGNSSGIGYDHYVELTTLGQYISNVHIKDRKLHGSTMTLGTGSADFDKVFSGLKTIEYTGSIILQAARGKEGEEKGNIKKQMNFIHNYLDKYGLTS